MEGKCRDPNSGNKTYAYVNPPLVYTECHPFYFQNGFRDLRYVTKVTAGVLACDRQRINITQLADDFERGYPCPANITLTRSWRVKDKFSSNANTYDQTIHICTTLPPPYNPRPICLWRNASSPARQYSFGLLQTSPFFGFGITDICTYTIKVDFVSCLNSGPNALTSSASCIYDPATDELVLTGTPVDS